VPQGLNGPVAVFITKGGAPLSGDVINRQSQPIVAGPTVIFVDNKPDQTSKLIRKISA